MTWFHPLSKRNATMSRPAFVDVVRSNSTRRTWQWEVFLPGFTPICADLKNKFAYAVINVRVAETYTTGGEALSIKVAKNSLAYVGMFVGSGKKGAEVTAIDKSNAGYDVLTIKAAFGENICQRCCIIQCGCVDGLKQKHVANSFCRLTVQRLRTESHYRFDSRRN